MMNNLLYLIVFIIFQTPTESIGDESFDVTYYGKYGTIVAEEYWIYKTHKMTGSIDSTDYNERHVEYGSELASKESLACLKKGHKQLQGWLEDEKSKVSRSLQVLKENGGTTNFFMWINDYHRNKAKVIDGDPSAPRFYMWRNTFIKYISTLLPNGDCLIPSEKGVISDLSDIIIQREKERLQDLNFIQRIFNGDRTSKLKKKINEIHKESSVPLQDGLSQ